MVPNYSATSKEQSVLINGKRSKLDCFTLGNAMVTRAKTCVNYMKAYNRVDLRVLRLFTYVLSNSIINTLVLMI